MKRFLLLITMLFSLTLHAKDMSKKAKKYMKQLGLQEHEMYYATTDSLLKKYGDGGSVNFPMNYLYNSNGKQMEGKLKANGVDTKVLSCVGTFTNELDCYMNDTGWVSYVPGNVTLQEEQNIFKPVYEYARPVAEGEQSLVIYYPVGVPLIKKYYRSLIEQVQTYHKQGKHIAIYFVMVNLKD